jgi:GDPmannose 4,6-dehydratase
MSRTPLALLTGASGQDGSYMSELLDSEGIGILAVARDPGRTRGQLPARLRDSAIVVPWDFRDTRAFADILVAHRPQLVCNFAAYSSGEGMFDDPVAIGEVNGLAVARILEAIREIDPEIRFCQASSSEMFGLAASTPQDESTPFHPRSPYGAAKLYGHAMIDVYRRVHGLFACSAILFNHESPRRGPRFVTRKVARAAAMIRAGQATELRLGNLDARRDWGFAGDHVRGMRAMLAADEPGDYVIATGVLHSVRELCELAFGRVGLDWREHVRSEALDFRATEEVQLCGNAAKARLQLDWRPRVRFEEVVAMMVDAELDAVGATSKKGARPG